MLSREKKVTIISRESDTKSIDIKLLEKELVNRGIKVDTLTKLLKKEFSVKVFGYLYHMLQQIKSISSSRVLILDTYCIVASMLPKSKKIKTVQMWHALSSVKKFGWQIVGKEDGPSVWIAKLLKMHKGYDYVTCSSDITANYFCEAFKVNKNQIVKLGLPRIDYIMKDNQEVISKIMTEYTVLANGKKNILYAPTFHGKKAIDLRELADAIDLNKYNLIVKLHPIDCSTSEQVIKDGIIYDNHYDIYDILKVADIIISDYSSLVVEASLTGKPIYLYTYDEDSYKQTTGLNMNFEVEPIHKYVFRDAGELVAAMDEEYDTEALNKFCRKYIDVSIDNCTSRLADFIESLL